MNRPYNVMIIDINEPYAQRLASFLGKVDRYSVVGICCDGDKMLSQVKSKRPDIILIDIFFGVYNSMDLLEWIHENFSYSPMVVVHTLISKSIAVRQTSRYGVKQFIKKPIDMEAVLGKLDVFTDSNSKSGNSGEDIKTSLEYEITSLLHILAVPPHVIGYKYLKDAVRISVLNGEAISGITKSIYPVIGKKWKVSNTSVEKSMRHAVELAWNRCHPDIIIKIFGNSLNFLRDRPTNSEFIAMLADRVRLKLFY